jgi:hypothetical protein
VNVSGIVDANLSKLLASGLFESVNGHEPKSAPAARGLTAATWWVGTQPVPAASGLGSTTARVELQVRLYTSMLTEPQDAIDPGMMSAVDVLMGLYSGDFDLGGLVRNVDLLAAAGAPLSARSGHIRQDDRVFRVADITLPLIVNDAWTQAP